MEKQNFNTSHDPPLNCCNKMKAFDPNESKYVSDSELTFKLKSFACLLDSFRNGF
jgi:hypothetical protein